MNPKHKHKWRREAWGPAHIEEICKICNIRRRRDANEKEKKLFKRYNERMDKECKNLHFLYHDFIKKSHKTVVSKLPKKITKGRHRKHGYSQVWKYEGYPLMEMAEKWAKRYPSVKVVHCDDDHFANSSLICIPHQTKRKWMGVTVIYVPQCSGDKPSEFFLYPDDVKSLITALQGFDKSYRRKKTSDD